jgi:O-antigen ligase
VSADLQHRHDGGRYYVILGAVFLGLLGLLGGASRPDELQQFFIRAGSIIVLAMALWPLRFANFRDARGATIAAAAVYLLLIAQLVPLPSAMWARMPGHDAYVAVARQTDSVAWRPWSVSPDLTLNSLAALIPATAMGLVALALDFRGRMLLARIIAAIACASAVLGLMQLAAGGTSFHLFRTSSESSAVGLFANRNHEAVLMACGLPIVSALASIRTHRDGWSTRHLALAICAAVLLLMALAATGSRMGLLLGSVGSVAAAVIYLTTSRATGSVGRSGARLWVAGGGFVIAAALPVSLLLARSGAVARLMHDPVDETRAAAFAPMLQAARAFLPFGAGFGTFDPVYRRFEPGALLSTIYLNQAHNEPMQLAIEGGIPALILLALFLAWWLYAVVRTIRPRESSARRALGTAMAAATLILMLSSLVDYPLRTPLLSGLFAIACVELLRSKRRGNAAQPS